MSSLGPLENPAKNRQGQRRPFGSWQEPGGRFFLRHSRYEWYRNALNSGIPDRAARGIAPVAEAWRKSHTVFPVMGYSLKLETVGPLSTSKDGKRIVVGYVPRPERKPRYG